MPSSINSLNLNTFSGGTSKTSSNTEFSTKLKQGVAAGASMSYQSIAPIAPFVPGAAVMSAMLGNTAQALASDGIASGAGAPMMGMGTGLSAPGGGGLHQSMQEMQQNMMAGNLYMLNLQQGFNQMSQQYTAASNILKTKHDTEKNAIQNFR